MSQGSVTDQPGERKQPPFAARNPLQRGPILRSGRSHHLAGALLYRSGPLAAGFVVATGLLAALLVPLHGWRAPIVVPVLVLVTAGLVWLVRFVPARPQALGPVAAVVAISAGHGWWAAVTHSEHVVLRRDAGSYALFTQWISTRHGLPVDALLQAFGGGSALADPNFRLASPAFFEVVHGSGASATAEIVPQFLLGAPSLFSLGWWAGGWTGLLIMPAILSGLAMLALGGLAARLIGARWAVLAVAVLALAQPMIHAARSTYSEPAATILVAVAAALLVDAVRRLQPRVALAAGLAFGLCGLVRVDALREVSLVLPVAAVLALRSPSRPLTRPLVIGALGGTVVAAIPAVLLSRPYLGGIAASLIPLIGGGVVLGLGSLVAVRLVRRSESRSQGRSESRGSPGIGRVVPGWVREHPEPICAGLVALAGVVLASRPLWMTVRQSPRDPGSKVVAGLQLRQGLTVDGGRTYAEHSLNWINWYLGPLSIVLAWAMFAGLAFAAVRWWRVSREHPEAAPVPVWLGPAVIAFGSLVLTLYRPGITPDHPWADRRMVPIVIPAFVIAATAMLAWIVRRTARRPAEPAQSGQAQPVGGRRVLHLAVAVLGSAGLLGPAVLATVPVATASTERGELRAVQQVCAALEPGDAVIAIDNRAANEWPQVIRGVCGRPSASVTGVQAPDYAVPLPAMIARIEAAGRRPVLLAATPDGVAAITALGLTPAQVTDVRTREDQHLLIRRPDGEDRLGVQVWLGRPRE